MIHRVSYNHNHQKNPLCVEVNPSKKSNWECSFNDDEVTCKNCLKKMRINRRLRQTEELRWKKIIRKYHDSLQGD